MSVEFKIFIKKILSYRVDSWFLLHVASLVGLWLSQEEDRDLSDSEMFKLDDALAEAFKSMKRKNKNSPEEIQKRREVKHFKLR